MTLHYRHVTLPSPRTAALGSALRAAQGPAQRRDPGSMAQPHVRQMSGSRLKAGMTAEREALEESLAQDVLLARLALQLFAEHGMRDGNERLGALGDRLALEVHDPVLGRDI